MDPILVLCDRTKFAAFRFTFMNFDLPLGVDFGDFDSLLILQIFQSDPVLNVEMHTVVFLVLCLKFTFAAEEGVVRVDVQVKVLSGRRIVCAEMTIVNGGDHATTILLARGRRRSRRRLQWRGDSGGFRRETLGEILTANLPQFLQGARTGGVEAGGG